jgi:thioredoxin reductase
LPKIHVIDQADDFNPIWAQKLKTRIWVLEVTGSGMDAGRVKAYFGQTVKEVTHDEVVLMSARERDPKTAKESARIKNDYVLALIGGEKPTKFLESIGVKIG